MKPVKTPREELASEQLLQVWVCLPTGGEEDGDDQLDMAALRECRVMEVAGLYALAQRWLTIQGLRWHSSMAVARAGAEIEA